MSRWPSLRSASFACLALIVIFGSLPSGPSHAADGAWKEKTQVVWSKEKGALIRKNFRVWDPHPGLDLDFLWEPRLPVSSDNSDNIVSGAGTLTWYAKGAASYDRRFTYSVFKGVLKNGRPEGHGVLAVRTGLSYTGQWRDGEMHGRGVLRLENGDKYEGDFVAGKMQGLGKYVSTDGSVYLGEFRNGVRDGLGKLTLDDGAYRTVWRDGREIERQLILDSAPVQSKDRVRLAAISNTVKLTLSMDQKNAVEFENADPDSNSHTYEAEHGPRTMTIRLASKMILGAWKGDGSIASAQEDGVPYIVNSWQFMPVFLKAEVENDGTSAAQITSAFLDISESTTDLEPYLELHHSEDRDCQTDGAYNPVLEFRNLGWGRVRDARMTFSLGTDKNRTDEASVSLGTFDTAKTTSIVDRLKRLGVDVERLRRGSTQYQTTSRLNREQLEQSAFRCERSESSESDQTDNSGSSDKQMAVCFERVKNSGVLGSLKDQVFMTEFGNVIYTTAAGHMDYRWTSNDGKTHTHASPFTINIPLIQFDISMGEMGCEEPIEHQVKSMALSLERRKYRITLPKDWNAKLPGSQKMQFDFALTAAKSSYHKFQLVLKLADGTQVESPVVDLSYFRPRLPKKR